jgi:GT2 family glycosyltransferase
VSSQTKPYGTRFTWHTGDPSVAIIIPTKNKKSLLEKCINSILKLTSYKNFNIHLVDNNSTDPETLDYYQKLKSEPRIKIHSYPAEFNYSQAVNLGVAQSDSDLVLFLNDDMETINSDWLTELVQWATRPEIGVVGGKLIRANHSIQHAGIIIGLHGFAGHIYLNAPEHYQGLFGSVDWYRDYQALTGACQMMRREVFNEIGGYDEGYKIAFGDIDFCLRVQQSGYRNIYTPFSTLFHYEGRSRGYITPKEDVLRGYTKMRDALTQEDPYFSPNLSYTRIPKCVLNEQTSEEREKIIEIRKRFHEKN